MIGETTRVTRAGQCSKMEGNGNSSDSKREARGEQNIRNFANSPSELYDGGLTKQQAILEEQPMNLSRRHYLQLVGMGAGAAASALPPATSAQDAPVNRASRAKGNLTIKDMRVTPIALPDPPLLASSGCHGPYFLRTIVEIVTAD